MKVAEDRLMVFGGKKDARAGTALELLAPFLLKFCNDDFTTNAATIDVDV